MIACEILLSSFTFALIFWFVFLVLIYSTFYCNLTGVFENVALPLRKILVGVSCSYAVILKVTTVVETHSFKLYWSNMYFGRYDFMY